MQRPVTRALVSALAALALGCGASDHPPSDAGGGPFDAGSPADAGPGTDAGPNGDAGPGPGVDAGPGLDGGATSACPASLPAMGASCDREALVCGYGQDPRVTCRPYATCTSGAWVVTDPGCPALPPVMCPATREIAADQPCTPLDAYCAYDGVPCRCTNCIFYPIERCMGPLTWHCDAPSADPGCPAGIPNAGVACTAPEGTQCVYGCEPDMARTCSGGVWAPSSSPTSCPISTRRAKRDIRYLDDAQVSELADEVLAMRLATYEYTDPALDGRRRLGFILEDQPAASFATDPERSQVDLYGYVSMLVAVVQEQQRELAALRQAYGERVRRRSLSAGRRPSHTSSVSRNVTTSQAGDHSMR